MFCKQVAELKCQLERNVSHVRAEFESEERETRKCFPERLQMERNIARFGRNLDERRKDFPVMLLLVNQQFDNLFLLNNTSLISPTQSKCDIEHPAILEDRELLAVCKRCGFAGFFEVSAKDAHHEVCICRQTLIPVSLPLTLRSGHRPGVILHDKSDA